MRAADGLPAQESPIVFREYPEPENTNPAVFGGSRRGVTKKEEPFFVMANLIVTRIHAENKAEKIIACAWSPHFYRCFSRTHILFLKCGCSFEFATAE